MSLLVESFAFMCADLSQEPQSWEEFVATDNTAFGWSLRSVYAWRGRTEVIRRRLFGFDPYQVRVTVVGHRTRIFDALDHEAFS